MGLKKDTPDAQQGEAGATPAGTTQPPAENSTPPEQTAGEVTASATIPPVETPPKIGTEKVKAKNVILLAVKRTISDPYSKTVFTKTVPQAIKVSPGDWADCQMKAGLLKEYVAPVAPEGE